MLASLGTTSVHTALHRCVKKYIASKFRRKSISKEAAVLPECHMQCIQINHSRWLRRSVAETRCVLRWPNDFAASVASCLVWRSHAVSPDAALSSLLLYDGIFLALHIPEWEWWSVCDLNRNIGIVSVSLANPYTAHTLCRPMLNLTVDFSLRCRFIHQIIQWHLLSCPQSAATLFALGCRVLGDTGLSSIESTQHKNVNAEPFLSRYLDAGMSEYVLFWRRIHLTAE